MKIRAFAVLGGALLALTLTGCATTPAPFGDSVRHMAEGQVYDPSAPHEGADGVDGQKAARAVESYRAPKQSANKSPTPMVVLPTSQ